MRLWGEPDFDADLGRGLIKLLVIASFAVVGITGWLLGLSQAGQTADRAIDLAKTYQMAWDNARERERLSMRYIRDKDPSLAAELERRNRLWGASLDRTP